MRPRAVEIGGMCHEDVLVVGGTYSMYRVRTDRREEKFGKCSRQSGSIMVLDNQSSIAGKKKKRKVLHIYDVS
jgi:hypothetical protein